MKGTNNLTSEDIQRILKIRIRDIDLKCNFPKFYSDRKCWAPDCFGEDSSRHIFECSFLGSEGNVIEENVLFDSIFGNDVSKIRKVSLIMQIRIQKRKHFLPPGDRGALDPRRRTTPVLGIRETRTRKMKTQKT